jgi:hypothetical protein
VRGFTKKDIQKNGKTLPRCTSTQPPLKDKETCCFNFLLKCNSTHWFLQNGFGNYHHTGHSKRIHQSTGPTLSEPEKMLITNMNGRQLSTMAIQQLFFSMIPKLCVINKLGGSTNIS